MDAKQRLEELRTELRNETISQLELMELESLAEEIDSGDTELLLAAGVPEDREERAEFFRKRAGLHSPLPWFYYDDGDDDDSSHIIQTTILGEKYDLFSTMDDFVDTKERKANVEFVIKAVNNHYQLVEALKLAEARMSDMIQGVDYCDEMYEISTKIREVLRNLE